MAGARRIDPKEVSAEEALGYKKPAHRAAEGLTLGQRVRTQARKVFGGGEKPQAPKPAVATDQPKKKKKPMGGAGSAHVDKYKDIMP